MLRFSLAALLAALVIALSPASGVAQDDTTPLELFNQRIMPIFRSPQPSSCVQCHLAAVDLKNYILPSHTDTFVSLRDQGLIDLAQPEKSKILTLIRMGEKDLDTGARLIHEQTRQAEYTAFAGWIEACCNDPNLRDLPPLNSAAPAGPDKPDEVIRHARKSRVVDSFARIVWSQRMRCFPCHTPHEINPEDPRHQAAIKTRREFTEKYGQELVRRLDIFRETPEATLEYLIEASRDVAPGELPLINLDQPRKSLLVLKPLSKLPEKRADGTFEPAASAEPVTHMGGLKMHPDDQSYKSFIAWLQDYALVVGDRYASVDELPADNWHASEQVLRMTDTPPSWTVGVPVQLFVHVWSDELEGWEPEAIAFTQGTVTPRGMVNGSLFIFAPQDGADGSVAVREQALSGGRYLVKAYVDSRQLLAKDPTLLLGDEEFQGQVELTARRWREGFRQAASVSGRNLAQQ